MTREQVPTPTQGHTAQDRPDTDPKWISAAIVGLLLVIPYSNDIWGFAIRDHFGLATLDVIDITSRLFILAVLFAEPSTRELMLGGAVTEKRPHWAEPPALFMLAAILLLFFIGTRIWRPDLEAIFPPPDRYLFGTPEFGTLHYWLLLGPGMAIVATQQQLLSIKVMFNLLQSYSVPTSLSVLLITLISVGLTWSNGPALMLSVTPAVLLMGIYFARYRRIIPLITVEFLWLAYSHSFA